MVRIVNRKIVEDDAFEDFLEKSTKKAQKKTRKEANIQKDIVDWLKDNIPGDKEIRKIHGSAFQKAGYPDLEMFWLGTTWSFEVKRPGENPTPLQTAKIKALRKTGNHVWVVRSVEDMEKYMSNHIFKGKYTCGKFDYQICSGVDFTVENW